jgi:hypothetical protein
VANTDPRRTIELLDELERLGFDDAAFQRLHHFWQRPPGDPGRHPTINDHRGYCVRTQSFQAGQNNARLQRRLEMVLDWYRHNQPTYPARFTELADVSVRSVPFLPLRTAAERRR